METRSSHSQLPDTLTHDPAEHSALDAVAHLEHELNDIVAALALLGVKRCSQCRQFFRSSEAGALFDCGQLICYACVPEWWQSSSAHLSVAQREKLEVKLSSWLRKHHGAQVVKQEIGKDSDQMTSQPFQFVVQCTECGGSGKLLEGERCRFCNGFGTVRIVLPG
jgi:hypothetical protein